MRNIISNIRYTVFIITYSLNIQFSCFRETMKNRLTTIINSAKEAKKILCVFKFVASWLRIHISTKYKIDAMSRWFINGPLLSILVSSEVGSDTYF